MGDIPDWVELEIQRVRDGNLTKLDLSRTEKDVRLPLLDFPEAIFELTQLQNLKLRGHNILEIPDGLQHLTNLTELRIYGGYTYIPEWISKLTNLTELTLSGAYRDIPESINHLTNLTELRLYGRYNIIPESINHLTNLTELRLYGGYSHIPKWISKLTNLTELMLDGSFTGIPEWISQLTNLTHLTLSGQVETIRQSIFELPSLAYLDMDSNRIRVVPREILNLRNLQFVSFKGNPIEKPPREIVERGLRAIRDYYEGLRDEDVDHLYEAKMIILGEGGAGKTTLAYKILDPDYELDYDEKSTEGIGVLQWNFLLDSGQTFRVNIWDFGGQEIYHATHQFFLTHRSLYALVADSRKEDSDFYYWLNIVELLTGDSPVLIVKNEKQDRKKQIGEPQLRQRFPNIAEILAANLATNRNLNRVIDAIVYQMEHLAHVGTPLPRSWVAVREALEQDTRNYIEVDEYYAVCDVAGLQDRSKQDTVLGYLHDLGVCLHFRSDPLLKRYVILKPHWGTSAVYTVLDNKAVIANFGRFTRNQLDAIWQDITYTGMHDELLRLMMRFKLCYEIPGMGDTYIAPQLLKEDQPAYGWNETDNLYLRYKYDFMPKGLVTRLIVAMHRYIADDKVWKTGVIFERQDTWAEVTERYQNRSIHIRLVGGNKKGLLAVIMHELEEIHASYPGLKLDALIPCNCDICKNNNEPYFFRSDVLQRSLNETDKVQCQVSFLMVNTRRLLDDALPAEHEQVTALNNERFRIEKLVVEQGGIVNVGNEDHGDKIDISGNVQGPVGGRYGDNTHNEFNNSASERDRQLAEMRELLEALKSALKDLSPEHAEAAEELQESASMVVEEASKEKPSSTRLKITREGLQAAADNLLSVAPTAVKIALALLGVGAS